MGNDITTAKESLKQLFEALELKRVVCVDDEYCRWDKSHLFGQIKALPLEKQKQIRLLSKINFEEDEAVWRGELETFWDESRQAFKDNVMLAIEALLGDKAVPPKTTGLSDLISTICELVELTPTEWDSKKGRYFTEAATIRTLFLFDKDLRKDGGSEDGGLQLLQEAISHPNTFCGILSDTFEAKDEFTQWQSFTKSYSLDENRFVLIAKQHLQQGSDHLGFARMIKLAILTPSCRGLAQAVGDSVRKSVDAALTRLTNISYYDFEDIVVRKSQYEGVWEAETLYRIFALFQKSALQQELKSNSDIKDQVQKIRSVIDIKTHVKFTSRPTSWEIQRLEWYENAEELNQHCIPISLGDIFENTETKKKYVLLCNACDLMIRADGERESGVTEVYLVELLDNKEGSEGFFELKYFDAEKSRFAKFKYRHPVYLNVLELCCVSETGVASFSLNQSGPDILIPSWQNRFKEISKSFTEVIRLKLDEPTPLTNTKSTALNPGNEEESSDLSSSGIEADDSETASAESNAEQSSETTLNTNFESNIPPSSRERLFNGQFNGANRSVDYSCKRVGRVSAPYADAMLTAFHMYLARPSFAADLARD